MSVAATNRSGNAVFAKEVHASAVWGVVLLLLPLTVFVAMASQRVIAHTWPVLVLLLPLVGAGAAMAWSGFDYSFSASGVEIRTLGFRLRSIPAYAIQSYAADNWNVLGGYGIRGLGGRKAYVWGNRGVRIMTDTGWVFLGHDNPEKIIRDLDLVTQRHAAQANRF